MKRRLLLVNSAAHLLVDGLSAAAVFGRIDGNRGLLLLLYNTLAFSLQCLTGLAADRCVKQKYLAAGSILLIVLGWALPLPAAARICFLGLGNCGFHVAGGIMTLKNSGGKARDLGIFVSPGAVGLTLGTLWPSLGGIFAILLAAAAGLIFFLEDRALLAGPVMDEEESTAPESSVMDEDGSVAPESGGSWLLIPVLLTLAVSVRAIGGTAVRFPWKTGIPMALILTAAVFAGKFAGGFLADRIGPSKSAVISIVPAALLIAFCSSMAVPSLLGKFALNLTMPVTLWLLYRRLPKSPGFAFGLAASALWPGTLAGRLLTLTGPALWFFVLLCFLFGLWAILYADSAGAG